MRVDALICTRRLMLPPVTAVANEPEEKRAPAEAGGFPARAESPVATRWEIDHFYWRHRSAVMAHRKSALLVQCLTGARCVFSPLMVSLGSTDIELQGHFS